MSWQTLRNDAEYLKSRDRQLSSLADSMVLEFESFGSALSHSLISVLKASWYHCDWKELFDSVFMSSERIEYESNMPDLLQLAFIDMQAFVDRDPATKNLLAVFLYYKGYKALQAHRVAHILHRQGRTEAAQLIQSAISTALCVDIHPAAVLGPGLLLDHGTGIVIGETTVVGANCSFLHGITLGSSGKEVGDRHPKIGNNVLIGCNAIVLGNIRIGNSCKIGSGSVVIKSIPDGCTAVGNPARVIGVSTDSNSAANMDFALKQVQTLRGTPYYKSWSLNADGSGVFEEVDSDKLGSLNLVKTIAALTLRFGIRPPEHIVHDLFRKIDTDADERISKTEFEALSQQLVTATVGQESRSSSSLDQSGVNLNTAELGAAVSNESSDLANDINSFLSGVSLAASSL